MKRQILAAFARSCDGSQRRVVDETLASMRLTVSVPVLERIREWMASGNQVILATAAPEILARPFAAEFGFSDCLSTRMPVDDGWEELIGEKKAAACWEWLQRGGRAAEDGYVVLSDHADDLPLLARAKQIVLQAPPLQAGAITALLSGEQEIDQIDPCEAQVGGGIWLWFDDAPKGPYDVWEVKTVLSKHRYSLIYCGSGGWQRTRPGAPLDRAVKRIYCPYPPSTTRRITILGRRNIVRNQLRVFH